METSRVTILPSAPLPDNPVRSRPRRALSTVQLVEAAFDVKYHDPEFHKYIDATWHTESVTGRTFGDDLKAAEILRSQIVEMHGPDVLAPHVTLWAIVQALREVLRLYRMQRKARRRIQAPQPDETEDSVA